MRSNSGLEKKEYVASIVVMMMLVEEVVGYVCRSFFLKRRTLEK
jgi:uncharacterized membrane protein YwzB